MEIAMINERPFENITLGEWLAKWFDTYKKPVLKPYSVRNIDQMIRLHTPEWLKAKRMVDITVYDIDRALSEIPLGRTRQYARQTWHCAFVKAQKHDIILRNVVALSDPVRYKKTNGKALSINEQNAFLKAIEGKRIKWVMLFYLYSGVRRAEAVSIEWTDIDEERGLILIKGTKTADSYRHILLSKELKETLDGQRKQNELDKGTKYESQHPEKVFNYSPSYLSQAFKKICTTHRLHNLRHNFITRCAESGVNVAVCQQVVGHSTPEMTLKVYTHVFDEYKRKELAKFSINPTF